MTCGQSEEHAILLEILQCCEVSDKEVVMVYYEYDLIDWLKSFFMINTNNISLLRSH